MAVKILHETDTVVCGTENDGFRALGIMLSLAALAPEYASEQTFTLHERLKNAIDAKHYAIAYERQDRESPLLVPVGFITWGLLSKAAAIVFEKRFRPLYPTELKSGKHLWVIDTCAQFGHIKNLMGFLDTQFQDHEEYKATRWRDNKLRVANYKITKVKEK